MLYFGPLNLFDCHIIFHFLQTVSLYHPEITLNACVFRNRCTACARCAIIRQHPLAAYRLQTFCCGSFSVVEVVVIWYLAEMTV